MLTLPHPVPLSQIIQIDTNNIEISQNQKAFQLEKKIEKEGKRCREILKQLTTMTYNVENPTALSKTISALQLLLNKLAKHQTFDEKKNTTISCKNQPTNLIHNQPVNDHIKNQKTCEAKSSKYLPLPIRLVYEFVCIPFRTDNLNCFRAS